MTLQEKQAFFWDYYKEVYGVRPHFVTDAEMNNEIWLDSQIAKLVGDN